MSRSTLINAIRHLEIEEKILNIGSLVALFGVFMPWFGGEWFGEQTVWTGFGFYTSFVGLLVFLSQVFILSLTVLPILGYQIVRPSLRDLLRLIVGLECVLLGIVVWSILTNIAFDRSHMEIRFGIYLTLVGSIVVSLYSFLRIQQNKKRSVQEFFHHPEDDARLTERMADTGPVQTEPELPPPPAPPPPAEKAEDSRLF